jgi:histidine ammonia-lyase
MLLQYDAVALIAEVRALVAPRQVDSHLWPSSSDTNCSQSVVSGMLVIALPLHVQPNID